MIHGYSKSKRFIRFLFLFKSKRPYYWVLLVIAIALNIFFCLLND